MVSGGLAEGVGSSGGIGASMGCRDVRGFWGWQGCQVIRDQQGCSGHQGMTGGVGVSGAFGWQGCGGIGAGRECKGVRVHWGMAGVKGAQRASRG